MDLKKLAQPEEVKTIDQLEAEYNKIFYKFDQGVVRIAVATVIANRMPGPAVWLMLVAPSSGGKTEVVTSFNEIPFFEPISELTANTFASGFKAGPGESSLLKRIKNGVLGFKDYTTIISLPIDKCNAILAQLREIYDGEYVKQIGNGEPIKWKGKMGAIAACTEAIYSFDERSSAKGPRFVYYRMSQPDRMGQSRASMGNNADTEALQTHIRECTKNVVAHVIGHMDPEPVDLGEEFFEKVLKIADFVTLARSGVEVDYRGVVTFAPAAEMPARFAGQMMALARAIITMNKTADLPDDHPSRSNKLTEAEKNLIYKTAFDSIPRTKRDPIYFLAQYLEGATSAGVAVKLRLPTEAVVTQLHRLAAHGVCTRIKSSGNQGDTWKINDKYRKTICESEGINTIPGKLEAPRDYDQDDFDIDEYNSELAKAEQEYDGLEPVHNDDF